MKYSKKKLSIFIGLDVALFMCVLYFITVSGYRDKFLPNSTVGGVDVSSLSAQEAKDKIADAYSRYQLSVTFRGGKSETLTAGEISYRYDPSGEVEEALKQQNPFALIISDLKGFDRKASFHSSYDADQLTSTVKGWDELKRKNMKKPVNAQLVCNDGSFSVAPEQEGTYLSIRKVTASIQDAVAKGEEELDLTKMDGIYKEPTVFADDKKLAKEAKQLNKILAGKGTVTYTLPDGSTKKVDGLVMKDWLKEDSSGSYKLDESVWDQKLKEYVASLAKSTDTIDKKHKFKTHSGKKIVVPASGYYGWKINQSEEAAQLRADIDSGKSVERNPVYSSKEESTYKNNYGFGKTYCEVDLSDQHLWLYVNGKVVTDTDLVSGTNDGEHNTPAGAYRVSEKLRNTTLTGPVNEDGDPEWESDVSYWMRLTTGGVGLHDADWRGAFGGDIWQYSGSHGCINLPPSITPKIYENVQVGTPVIVYYS